jgi:heme exporter protein B
MWRVLGRPVTITLVPRVEGGFALFLRQVAALAAKDIRAELRSKEVASGTLVFALLVLVVFNFAFDLRGGDRSLAAPGMLWVAILLAAMMGLGHVFAKEREQGGIEGLLSLPVDRSAIYLGKLFSAFVMTLVIEAAILPVFAVFTNLSAFEPGLLLIVLLGTIGLVTAGTLFSAMSAHTRTRELMLPVLLLPVSVPVLIAGVEGARLTFDGQPWRELLTPVGVLASFDVILLVLCPWLFRYVMEEMGS